MFFRFKNGYRRTGFTIIELLITISILGLLLTLGLVYYQDFNRRQVVVQGAKELKNNLRLAQSMALSGEKIEGCLGTFGGYKVDFSEDEYVISAVCNGIPVEYKRYPLLGTKWVDGPPYLIFKPLAGGVENPDSGGGPAEITLSSPSTSYSSEVTVSEGGEISVDDDVPYVPPPTPTPTPEATPTPGAPSPPPLAGCGESCGGDDDCQGGLLCGTPCPPGEMCIEELFCYNPSCEYDRDCDCSPPGGPTCIGGVFWGECGEDGCWFFERRHWLDYEPDGCAGDVEEFDRCEFDSNCFGF